MVVQEAVVSKPVEANSRFVVRCGHARQPKERLLIEGNLVAELRDGGKGQEEETGLQQWIQNARGNRWTHDVHGVPSSFLRQLLVILALI